MFWIRLSPVSQSVLYDFSCKGVKAVRWDLLALKSSYLPLSHGDDEKAEEGAVGEDFVGFSTSTEAKGGW